jgi:hypothetical protein
MDIVHIIPPERQGLWTAVAFALALLAFALAFAAMHRADTILVGTQAEVVALNNKIDDLKNSQAKELPAAPKLVVPAVPVK